MRAPQPEPAKARRTAFDYGLDVTECGIVRFYHAQDADELAPYMCLSDCVVS